MQNQVSFSTHKIIFSVFFIFAAIMTSVLVFHGRQKTKPPIISADHGVIFSVPRDIKSFELLAKNNRAFTQQHLLGHYTLLFFGFTHCTTICPTTLDRLSLAYAKIHASDPQLQIAMISLDPERDTQDKLSTYVQSFHPDFIGLTGKIQEIRKLQAQFGIHSERDDNDPNNYQLQHTPSILLINPKGKWIGIFSYNLKPNILADDILLSIKS